MDDLFDIKENNKGEKVLTKFNGFYEKTVVVPDDVVHIGDYAFEGKIFVEEIILPKGLKTIGKRSFDNCNKASIALPQGLSSIGESSFSYCKKLHQPLPQALTSIGEGAFLFSGLEEVVLPKGIKVIEKSVFARCESLKSIEIPDSVETIGQRAFSGCCCLKVIEIPNSLKFIDKSAFEGCEGMRMIYIPKSVEKIEIDAFKGCKNLSIYCEGEKKDDWIDNPERVIIHDQEDEREIEAFNFHRSAGSFDRYVGREVIKESFNPDKCPLYTNVSREEFIKLLENN